MDAKIKKELRDECLRIVEDTEHSSKAHFNAAVRWRLVHLGLGLPATVLSAGAAVLTATDWSIASAIGAGVAAILMGVQTFLKPDERASNHENAGNQLNVLRGDARRYANIGVEIEEDAGKASSTVSELGKRQGELNASAPQVDQVDFDKAKAGIAAGETTNKVDV